MRTAIAVLAAALVLSVAVPVGAQVLEEWVVRYDGPPVPVVDGPDWGYAITTDAAGNIYVTGGSFGSATDDDCTTIKYAPDGSMLWVNRYHYSGEDWGYAIAVDDAGYVYVTGLSSGPNGYDYLTIKYDTDGTRLWVKRFDGASHDEDAAYAILVDDSGNVYVTGRSEGAPYGTDDYVTIKYAPDGTELWIADYDGPSLGEDRAHAMVLDDAGNVYVTGGSESSGFWNFATIKYDSDGNELWVAGSPGTEGMDGGGWDIAVDSAGDVVVMGRSNDDGTGYDYTTIKYDAATGTELWKVEYDGPASLTDAASRMVLDADDNIYITGRSHGIGTDFDYATVKYDAGGVEQWVRRYDGPAGGIDRAYRIALGNDGCVSVVGYSTGSGTGEDYATIKYDTDGTEQWLRRYDGEGGGHDWGWAIATDSSGSVIVTGRSTGVVSGMDYATIKYSAAGTELWTDVYRADAGGGNQDWAYAMAVDAAGNSYVTGGSVLPGTDDDIRTFKYDTDGNVVWDATYDGPASGEDWGYAIAVDDAGCVYVTGLSDGVETGRDYVTIMYAADGTENWVRRYDGPAMGGGYDAAYAIALDADGSVFVTGNSAGDDPNESPDYAVVKYASDGTELWVGRYDHGWDDDRAHAIATGSDGSVYVTGGCCTGSRYDIVTVKYAADGTELWARSSLGASSADGGGWAIRVGSSGDVWVSGRSVSAAYDYDFRTLKYGSDGTLEWASAYDGPGAGDDKVCDMVVDATGNAYVTGYSSGPNGYDYATVKYDPDGAEEWVARYDGLASSDDRPYEMTLTPTGGVCVTGKSQSPGCSYDYATVCYTGFGESEWTMLYDGTAGSEDWGYAIGADGGGNIYVTGKSCGVESDFDYVTIKYAVDGGTPVEGYCYATETESGTVRLRWSVASLAGIQAFDVWRATSEEGPFERINAEPLAARENMVFDDLTVWPDSRFWYEIRARIEGGGEEVLSGGAVSVLTGGSLSTKLYPASPNPIVGSATLHFDIARSGGLVDLSVYNVRGQIVRTIVNGLAERGRHVRTWDATDDSGQRVATGVYFLRLTLGEFEETAKVLLLR